MTQNAIKNWLKSGALLRDKEGHLWVWESLELASKTSEFSVAYTDFFGSKTQVLKTQSGVQEWDIFELKKSLFAMLEAMPLELARSDFSTPNIKDFQNDFQQIQQKIQRGEIEKAVPVVFSKSKKVPSLLQRARWVLSLLDQPLQLYIYGIWSENEGVLGASPELLFEVQGPKIKSMALAGTCPRSEATERQSLLRDPKELHEHQIVIKDIEQRLSKWGYVQKGETQILELPTLMHLQTHLEVLTQAPLMDELIQHLHPTPALGVSPRNYGLKWMAQLSSQKERGYFGAPITFKINSDKIYSVVAIRNIMWRPEGSWVGSGCGVVGRSDLNQEFKELEHKINSVFLSLGIE